MTVRISSDKDVRYAARALMRLGFQFSHFRHGGKAHAVFLHATHGEISLPESPSDRNWLRAHRRELARLMGVTVGELEARIVGQAKIGKRTAGPRPGRKRNRPPRSLRHLTDVSQPGPEPAPAAEPVPVEPAPVWRPEDPISPARRRAWRERAEELARLNAEERLRPRRAAA